MIFMHRENTALGLEIQYASTGTRFDMEFVGKDGDGSSPCAVIDHVGTNYDRVIGQWDENKIRATDVEKARSVHRGRASPSMPN
jgi:hypothetical protein